MAATEKTSFKMEEMELSTSSHERRISKRDCHPADETCHPSDETCHPPDETCQPLVNLCQPQKGCKPIVDRRFVNLTTFITKFSVFELKKRTEVWGSEQCRVVQ